MDDVTLLSMAMGSFVAELHTPIEHPKAPTATGLKACPERLIDNCPGNYDRIVIARPTVVGGKTVSGYELKDVGTGDAVLVILIGWPADGGPIDPDIVEYQVPRASLEKFLSAGLGAEEPEPTDDEPDEPEEE